MIYIGYNSNDDNKSNNCNSIKTNRERIGQKDQGSMRYRKKIVLFTVILLFVSFTGCTWQYNFSYQEKEIPSNETYTVGTKGAPSIYIGYSWTIIDYTGNNTNLNVIIFRIIAPSGKEALIINATEKNRLYEGDIKCREEGIYELSWENTNANNTIRIRYDWDWAQEYAMLYTFICYGAFLLMLVVIVILAISLHNKNIIIKRLEKRLTEKEIVVSGNNSSVKDQRITAKLFRFFYQNENHPNLAKNIEKMTIIGFATVFLTTAALFFLPLPDVIEGWPVFILIILILGGGLMFIIGGMISFVSFYVAWLYTRDK